MFSRLLLTLCLALTMLGVASAKPAKSVFAHFMVGNVAGYTSSDWESNIQQAQLAKLDGFALNCGPQDSYTATQLGLAYAAADKLGFKLFISFDYASAGPWDVGTVINLINEYKSHPSQFMSGSQPFVSTFEGVANAGDWPGIKAATGAYLVPDWTSVGPAVFGATLAGYTDGAFSWDAWSVGPTQKSTVPDTLWEAAIGSAKTYMMGVSPWFYTNLPEWSKNWMWTGDTLFINRLEQVLQLQPDMVEIITWNDYGESHYVGPLYPAGFPGSSARYVAGMTHSSWLDVLPAFVSAYKAGRTSVTAEDVDTEQAVFWYRTHPASSGSSAGTVGNDPAYQSTIPAVDMTFDGVYVAAVTKGPGSVTVTIGGVPQTQTVDSAGVTMLVFPFNGHIGTVTVSQTTTETVTGTGVDIEAAPTNGIVNFNAYVGGTNTAGAGAHAD